MDNNLPRIQKVWLADDDLDDQEIFGDALKEALPLADLRVLSSGDELFSLLNTGERPDMLFLDINMPCNGFDCLKEIRQNRQLKTLPVIIFSSSGHPKDIDESYRSGANLFYRKPSSFTLLIQGLKNLLQMDWSDPYTITSKHYINRNFVPYASA